MEKHDESRTWSQKPKAGDSLPHAQVEDNKGVDDAQEMVALAKQCMKDLNDLVAEGAEGVLQLAAQTIRPEQIERLVLELDFRVLNRLEKSTHLVLSQCRELELGSQREY